MSDIKWIKGPWHTFRIGNDVCVLTDENAGVAVVDIMDSGPQEVATGQLISAAPDLYESLYDILSSKHQDVRIQPDHLANAYRALAKARGES